MADAEAGVSAVAWVRRVLRVASTPSVTCGVVGDLLWEITADVPGLERSRRTESVFVPGHVSLLY